MKKLNQYIQEKFELNKNTKIIYNYHPKTKEELRKILEERLAEDKDANLNDIDVSKITDMGEIDHVGLFERLDPHNIDISKWDVSSVIDMNSMFDHCENFNCDLGSWNVSRVENMRNMFNRCIKFEGKGLEKWKPNNVRNFFSTFMHCESLNVDLECWKIDKKINMNWMFYQCTSLKKEPSWYITFW